VSQTMIRGFRIARRKEEPEPGAQGSALFTLKSYDHQVEFASEGHRLLKSRHVADGSIWTFLRVACESYDDAMIRCKLYVSGGNLLCPGDNPSVRSKKLRYAADIRCGNFKRKTQTRENNFYT